MNSKLKHLLLTKLSRTFLATKNPAETFALSQSPSCCFQHCSLTPVQPCAVWLNGPHLWVTRCFQHWPLAISAAVRCPPGSPLLPNYQSHFHICLWHCSFTPVQPWAVWMDGPPPWVIMCFNIGHWLLVQLCAARLGSPLLPTYLSHFHIPVCDHQLIHRSPSYTMLSIFYATTTKCTLTNLNTRLNVFLFPEHQAETLCWDQLVR